MTILLPNWFEKLKPTVYKDRLIRNRFLVRQAAILSCPEGSLHALADISGISYYSLIKTYQKEAGIITPDQAIRLERAVGKAAMPRELIRPDYFYD